jgi:hypothetical protein
MPPLNPSLDGCHLNGLTHDGEQVRSPGAMWWQRLAQQMLCLPVKWLGHFCAQAFPAQQYLGPPVV